MGVNAKSNVMITAMAKLLGPPVDMVILGSQIMRPEVRVKRKGAKQHYESMPSLFNSVICIDINGKRECYDYDLSEPRYDWHDSFDLLYNGGTLEHVSNQQAAWLNAHYLLRAGGIAVHVCPLVGGWLGHSDYLYKHSFFAELIAANKYKSIVMPQVVKHAKGEAVYLAFQKVSQTAFYWSQTEPFVVKQV
jgi:SAM-dependent methyltransferase